MEALNSRCVRSTPRRTLTREVAPTAIAPSGPSSTVAASVADELGDQADWREVSVVGAESQTRNSSASTNSAPDLAATLSVSVSLPRASTSTAAAAATTTPTYSQATSESPGPGPPSD